MKREYRCDCALCTGHDDEEPGLVESALMEACRASMAADDEHDRRKDARMEGI